MCRMHTGKQLDISPQLPYPRCSRLGPWTLHPLLRTPIPVLRRLRLRQIHIIKRLDIDHEKGSTSSLDMPTSKHACAAILAKSRVHGTTPECIVPDFVNTSGGDQSESLVVLGAHREVPLLVADSTVALAEFPGGGVWGEVDFVFDLATVAGSGVGSIRHFASLIGGGRYCDTGRDIYNIGQEMKV